MLRSSILILLILTIGATLPSSIPTQGSLSQVFAYTEPTQVIPTMIALNVSTRVIFVGENFTVLGSLMQQNGIVLSGKPVTVSWANRSVILQTAWNGRFVLANVSFPVGFPKGFTRITADYLPTDQSTLSSHSYVEVQVLYRPSTLKATVTPEQGKPSEQATVAGTLLGSDGESLQDREIAIELDGDQLGTVVTDASGSFSYNFNVPEEAMNGTHVILVSFNPTHDPYAPSNVTLPFLVEVSATTTSTIVPTGTLTKQLVLNVGPALLSGMSLTISGTACGYAPMSGSVTIYFDGNQTAVGPVNSDGTFNIYADMPMMTSLGLHTVKAISRTSSQGQEDSCEATATVFVLNTPLSGALVAAILLTSAVVMFKRRRKDKTSTGTDAQKPDTLPLAPKPVVEPVASAPTVRRPSIEDILSSVNHEKDHTAKVTHTYYIAQDLIGEKLGVRPETNETHREYCERVVKAAPNLTEPLDELSVLFEMATFTSTPIDATLSGAATGALMRLFQQLEIMSPAPPPPPIAYNEMAPRMVRGPDAVSTARGASYLWLQNIVSSVARIAAFALFARLIPVEEMGVYTILSLAFNAANVFTVLGLPSIVTKFVAEGEAKGDRVKGASVYYEAVLLTEVLSVLLAAGLIIAKFPAGISNLPNSQENSLIGILFAADVIASLGSVPAAAFYGLLEFKLYALIYSVYASLRPWLVILLIYETKSLVGLVGAWVISDSVLSVTVFLYLWRRLGPPIFRFDVKYLLKLASPLYVAGIALFLYGSFDQLTLIPLVSLSALGVYGAAITAFSAYSGMIGVLGSVLLPVFSGVHGINGFAGLKSSVEKVSRYVSIVGMPLAFALLVTARPAITLLVGGAYEAGALPLGILALASTATIISFALSPILIVLNETLLAALAAILPIPISVGLALISIPTMGIVAASVARAFSMVLSLLLTWYFVRRKISVKLDSQTIIKSIGSSVAMAGAMEGLQILYYSRYLLPVYVLVGLLVYLLAMRVLKAMTKADINLLQGVLGPRSQKICALLSKLVVT